MSTAIQLNDEQQIALEKLEHAYDIRVRTGVGAVFQIDGPAGTGKTELIRVLTERYDEKHIVICAPTHKACQVLQERLQSEKNTVTTCHRFLEGYTRYTKNGQMTWKFKVEVIPVPDLIVLDEVSMVDEDVFNAFRYLIQHRMAFVVTTGDRCQLPPINWPNTPFYIQYPVNVSLTRNMRNQRVSFNACLEQLRTYIFDPACALPRAHEVCEYLATYVPTYTPQWGRVSVQDIPQQILESYAKSPDAIMLAHRTNLRENTVEQLNQRLRTFMFGKTEEYVVGDRLIFTDYFKPNGKEQVFHTNDRATVHQIQVDDSQVFYGETYRTFRMLLVPVQQAHGQVEVHKLHPSDRERWLRHDQRVQDEIKHTLELKSKLSQSAQDEMWNTYYESKKAIDAPVDYAYCLSIHKSQGSSYQSVFVFLSDFAWMLYRNTQDLENRRMFYKLLYVALSRSRTTACVF